MVEVLQNGLAAFDQQRETLSFEMAAYAQKFNWEQCINDYLSMYNKVMEMRP
jgi:glycosyltransferase involved in cell wall biosynthesis